MDDRLDSRDLQERIDELESTEEELDQDEQEELEALRALKEEVSDDLWEGGVTFIPVSYWEEYAREFAEDIGVERSSNDWPLYCIDWEQAAKELALDYTMVEYNGQDYYYRAD